MQDESPIDRPRPHDHPMDWDRLLAKYVRIWIWSILFGATSGLTYAYVGVRFERPWGPLAVLPMLLLTIGITCTLGGWTNLLAYLEGVIVPEFFLAGGERIESADLTRALLRAYKYTMLAGIVRLFISLNEIVVQLAGRIA
jgi:hypothetical protein